MNPEKDRGVSHDAHALDEKLLNDAFRISADKREAILSKDAGAKKILRRLHRKPLLDGLVNSIVILPFRLILAFLSEMFGTIQSSRKSPSSEE